MQQMIKKAAKHLKKQGWECDTSDPDHLFFQASINEGNISHDCIGSLDNNIIFLACFFPQAIPPEKRQVALELANQINLIFYTESMELDMDSGILRLRNGLYLANSTLTPDLIDDFISLTIFMADRLFPIVTKVIDGECDPKQAVTALYTEHSVTGHRVPQADTLNLL